jgi:hypothetical protein
MVTSDRHLDAFEERLLAELKTVVATRTADGAPSRPARVPRRRLVLSAAAVTTAIAAVVATTFALSGGPAYAVQRDPDGSIHVSVYDYRDPDGLRQRIEAFGVKAVVTYLPAGTACQVPRAMVDWLPGDSDNPGFRIHPQYIRPDQTLVYTVQLSQHHGDRVQRAAIRLANGPVAACRPVPGDVVPGHS